MRLTFETLEKKLRVYQDALAELEIEHGKYVPLKYNNKVKE